MCRSPAAITLAALLIAVLSRSGEAGVTMEQMQQTAAMMRQACQPKFKVSDEVADAIRDRVFAEDKNVKCYVNCIMEMMQMMKKGKLNYDNTIKQMEMMLPDELKADMISALGKCKGAAVGIKDNCEASYALLKCQAANVETFVFA